MNANVTSPPVSGAENSNLMTDKKCHGMSQQIILTLRTEYMLGSGPGEEDGVYKEESDNVDAEVSDETDIDFTVVMVMVITSWSNVTEACDTS
jgi:hypothetical protein